MTFEVIGTQEVQMESLRLFMLQMGYVPNRENGGWITLNPQLQANRVISTRTAIKLHNLSKKGWKEFKPGWYHPAGIPVDIAVNSYSLNILFAHKIVEQVKLHPKRDAVNGFVFPPDLNANLIKFTDKRYHRLFGLTPAKK